MASMVLVVEPTVRPRIDQARVSEEFGLTPAKSPVAALLTEAVRRVRS